MKGRLNQPALGTLSSRSRALLPTLIFLFGILIPGPCMAQKQEKMSGPPATELGKENMGLVAASAADIKATLVGNPGLMVELKRWIAKDATDHGQIVSESDLTEDAISSRLETDVRFRAVATQILQRYGYLVPTVNPDSALGKEQDLLIQERVKWLAQNQEEQLAAARQKATQNVEQNAECDQQVYRDCNPPQIPTSPVQGNGPQPQVQASPQGQGPPTRTPPSNYPQGFTIPLEQAEYQQNNQLLPDSSGVLQYLSGNGLALGQSQGGIAANPFGPLTPQAGANLGKNGVSPFFDLNNLDGQTPLLWQSLSATPPFAEANRFPPTQYDQTNRNGQGGNLPLGPTSYSPSPNEYQRYVNPSLLQPVEMTRAPDPYADIPSLYDMYLQATPHPATPERFGIDIFQNGFRDPQLIPMDLPASPDYIVGPGDGLAIDLWGGVSQRLYRVVDREGRVTLPEVGPILVSGKSLADVQQSMQQVLRSQFRDVSADVSLARLRTIRVYVVGDVVNPGAYDISSLSTPLNALFAAGGPTPRGSLRIVKHYRDDQLVQTEDLYDLLLHGVRSDLQRLDNGDTVLVPPIGPEVTVEGMVRRPAIYELKDETDLKSVLDLAGGILPTAALSHIEVQRIVDHKEQTMISLDIPEGLDASEVAEKLSSFKIHDGDRIRLFPIAAYNQNAVYLEGHVIRPGRYSYRDNMKVTDIISSYKDLLPQPAQYAEIIRLKSPDFSPSVQGFDLAEALADPSHAPLLHPMDTVRIFSSFDFENPPTVSVLGDVRDPGTYRTPGQVRVSGAIHLAGGLSPDAQKEDAQVFRSLSGGTLKIFSINLNQALAGDPMEDILLAPRDRILVHRSANAELPATVNIQGAVLKPGRYPLTNDMTVADLIRVSGGLTPSADTQVGDLMVYRWSGKANLTGEHIPIEISNALKGDVNSNLPVHNGDVLTIRELSGWNDLGATISVKGEVKHPGSYGIQPGERLSSILKRAGGFTSQAYPYGAILQRVEVRELQAKQQDDMILRIKDSEKNLELLPEGDSAQKRQKDAALAQYQSTLTELSANPPLGRVAIRISLEIKRWQNTSADIEVRAGDTLYIPKKPDVVTVAGQVFNPTAVSYRPGKSARWYLGQSGGPTVMANKKAIFVMRADGSIISGKGSFWGGDPLSTTLAPGDSIIVPEKAIGGGPNWQNLFTAASVASSITSTIFIALRY